jgi:hypothetical protein
MARATYSGHRPPWRFPSEPIVRDVLEKAGRGLLSAQRWKERLLLWLAGADLLGQQSAVPYAILGMCGYLAAVTQAPLTSLVIVMEMTAQHDMVLPLMVTVIIATALSRLLSPPLYRTLAQRYL